MRTEILTLESFIPLLAGSAGSAAANQTAGTPAAANQTAGTPAAELTPVMRGIYRCMGDDDIVLARFEALPGSDDNAAARTH
jgi:hypothetical protein